jgi:peroxiredoxin
MERLKNYATRSILWCTLLFGETLMGDVSAQTSEESLPVLSRLELQDVEGKSRDFKEFQDSKLIVFLFIGTECPVSNGYCPEFRRIAAEFAERGAIVLGVHAEPTVSSEAARQHAKEYELKFPILMDPQQELAQSLGITVVPEVAVMLPSGNVIYRGRIDDRYSAGGKRRDEPRSQELRAAIKDGLEGRTPEVRMTKAFGCRLPNVSLIQKSKSTNK